MGGSEIGSEDVDNEEKIHAVLPSVFGKLMNPPSLRGYKSEKHHDQSKVHHQKKKHHLKKHDEEIVDKKRHHLKKQDENMNPPASSVKGFDAWEANHLKNYDDGKALFDNDDDGEVKKHDEKKNKDADDDGGDYDDDADHDADDADDDDAEDDVD